ncbi:hypothetical protein ARMA_2401 [Ardenticatena maritima]|uniref:Uncharacterized protein n=1 Tax=Ardenticatena maritima TaxID=872965 RepID=A0A0M9UDF6_9CHLR|nr:hypothetical protein ARMA_2401 [Ardenticatena maritima]
MRLTTCQQRVSSSWVLPQYSVDCPKCEFSLRHIRTNRRSLL